MLVGFMQQDRSSLRQVVSLAQPVHEPAKISSDLQQDHLATAARLGGQILRLRGSDFWRLNRVLHLYRQARCEQDPLERFHQYLRALEGPTKPPNQGGGTTKNFVARMTELTDPAHTDLFKRLYDRRGAVEHLREHEILRDRSRAARIGLVEDAHFAEFTSRSVLARIVDNDHLWGHFGTADSTDRFWDLDEAERRRIWGTPIDPSLALDGFDASMLSDEELGVSP
jgi:hypothetical protein